MTTEYEVAWSGTIETEAARAQQQRVETPARRGPSHVDVVIACLEDNPGATMRGISEITGLSQGIVNGTLYSLLRQKSVERSHRQVDDPGKPVQWRVRP